ncbi:hypothetical protein NPIL_282931 [Nephila pilipes]|uniref:Uncharacterized protein n=1 Tax=Nephila pilipes TaxID=299642 RepID=A0A8X6PIE6_NEPPI|nr:hypothetical protein NPIL_282931 [Nephila pilipes]
MASEIEPTTCEKQHLPRTRDEEPSTTKVPPEDEVEAARSDLEPCEFNLLVGWFVCWLVGWRRVQIEAIIWILVHVLQSQKAPQSYHSTVLLRRGILLTSAKRITKGHVKACSGESSS